MYVSDKKNRNVLVSTDHGLMIVNRFDTNTSGVGHGQWLLDHGNASTVEVDLCCKTLGDVEAPVIFDVGANIGTFTTLFAKTYPRSTIYSFEPQRTVFQQLCGNVAINNFYNVHTFNMALGNDYTTLVVNEPDYFYPNDFGTFSLVESTVKTSSEKMFVTLRKLDWFCDHYQIQRLDLLKIDVEGMDLQVLEGARNSIEKFSPIIFTEHTTDNTFNKDIIFKFFEFYGYVYHIHGRNVIAVKG